MADCSRCVKLASHAIDSEVYKEMQKWPQCNGCRLSTRNLVLSADGLCFSCPEAHPALINSDITQSLTARVVSDASRLRNSATQSRLKVGTKFSTDSLRELQNGGGQPGEKKVWICWEVRTSDKPTRTDSGLGNTSRAYAISVNMNEILSQVLEQINVVWRTEQSASLVLEDVSWHFFNNRLLQKGTANLSVGDFFRHYNEPSLRAAYLDPVSTRFKTLRKNKNDILSLEVYIDFNKLRNGFLDNISEVSGRRSKRRDRSSSMATSAMPSVAKHHRVGLLSEFAPSNPKSLEIQQIMEAIELRKIVPCIELATGKVSLEEFCGCTELKGTIAQTHFKEGKMKRAYKIILNDKEFVAKRFFTLGGSEPVSPRQSKDELKAELVRIAQLNWFFNCFKKRAEDHGIKIATNIEIVNAYIGIEVDDQSSEASGFLQK
ncbi:hypothetical protein M422DRAFT_265433 [Sphaerobolus stellatus SS14]|uniref:Uncharacterized protein n=1 Tax=Sphaerobolus stellatus (strain SS14) TaxID=990650 RepID=A0A0C9UTU7_SPHS4|nr:hypothetical protein M422DRAFT_265433 [Sphaerobolus stellatus SS14]